MKLEVDENSVINLKEVFTPIKLIAENGERLVIYMHRDSGFEICYNGKFYNLENDEVTKS